MASSRCTNLILALTLTASGCAYNPICLAERPFLAQQLPNGISMSDYVEPGPLDTRITVAEKLAWLGARPGLDGKIHDLLGNEIAFWRFEPSGAPGPEGRDRPFEAPKELRRRCTVIEMQRDPRLPYVQ